MSGETSSDLSEKFHSSSNEDTELQPQHIYADDDTQNAVNGTTSALRRSTTNGSVISTVEEQNHINRVLTEGSHKRDANTPIPKMGGGKDYPPDLPERDAWRVDFDGPDDPTFPQNWSWKKKIATCAILGYTTFCASWGSSVFSTAVTKIGPEYGIGLVPSLLTISLYIAGFASGPIIWGPMSELYGRKLPIVTGMFLFTCFNFACATAKDIQTIMITRFFSGFTSAAPLAVVAAAFSDIFNNMQRGTALSVFSGMVFIAPITAPIAGAFITESYLGWRWTMYITGMMSAAAVVMDIFFYEESYHPIILARKAVKLRQRTGNWGIYAPHEAVELDIHEIVSKNLLRPVKMLVMEPILFAVTLYTSLVYGVLYLLLEAYPIIFGEKYLMKPQIAQLPYASMIVGMLIAMGLLALFFEPRYNAKIAKNGFKPLPEARVPSMLTGAVAFPIGIFWLTWTGNYADSIHWIVPTLAGIVIGFSLLTIFVSCFQYIIDAYLLFAASAIAGNTIMRSAFGAAFPLFATQMFHNLGVNWAGTLLGCLAILMVPIPLVFAKFGKRLRAKSKFAFVLE